MARVPSYVGAEVGDCLTADGEHISSCAAEGNEMPRETPDQKNKRFEWERAIRRSTLTTGALGTGRALATYADKNGKAFPSVARLANDCNQSERTTQRHLAELEEAGWLHRALPKGAGRATDYTLSVPSQFIDVYAGVPPVSVRVTPVTPEGDASGTPTDQVTHIQTPTPGGLETGAPAGVSIKRWSTVRPVLVECLGRLTFDESRRWLTDWATFRAKAKFCEHVNGLVGNGVLPRAIVHELTEGGYQGVSNPARAMFRRLEASAERNLRHSDQTASSPVEIASRIDIAAIVSELASRLTPEPWTNDG